MNLPAKIILDRRHVGLFQPYAVPGARIEFLVLVSNQYGQHKINVYGFGEFPSSKESKDAASKPAAAVAGKPPEAAPAPKEPVEAPSRPEKPAPTPPVQEDSSPPSRPAEGSPNAKPGVADPEPPVAKPEPAVEPPLDDLALQQRIKATADLYLQSMKSYREGDLALARAGFLEVLRSGLVPPPMEETIRGYLKEIDAKLAP
jgi:TolA-binding protein